MLRRIAHVLSVPVIWLMMPVKRLAYHCRRSFLGRALLELTCFGDFLLVFANVQNAVLELHHRVWGGNFLFGKSVMVVDYEVAAREITLPALRGNRFMGVDIVSNDPGVFLTNAGPISAGQPTRRLDVDTQASKEFGYTAAKEGLTPEKYYAIENSSEDAVMKVRVPAMRLAEKLFH